MLFDTINEFTEVRDFCFYNQIDHMETEVAGFHGFALFAGCQAVMSFCQDRGLIPAVYPLVNPMQHYASSSSSGSTSSSFHPPSEASSSPPTSETHVSR